MVRENSPSFAASMTTDTHSGQVAGRRFGSSMQNREDWRRGGGGGGGGGGISAIELLQFIVSVNLSFGCLVLVNYHCLTLGFYV